MENYFPPECRDALCPLHDAFAMAATVERFWNDSAARMATAECVQRFVYEARSPDAHAASIAQLVRTLPSISIHANYMARCLPDNVAKRATTPDRWYVPRYRDVGEQFASAFVARSIVEPLLRALLLCVVVTGTMVVRSTAFWALLVERVARNASYVTYLKLAMTLIILTIVTLVTLELAGDII